MRILFISRKTIFLVPGGDTVQMVETANELKKMGVEVDIFDQQKEVDYMNYDLLHFFNLTRPADILFHTTKSDVPYVVSTIFVQYDFYKYLSPYSGMGLATRLVGLDGIEYLKTTLKHGLGKEKLIYFPYVWKGQKKSIQEVLINAEAILPNSASEAKRVSKSYGIEVAEYIVPNGINTQEFCFTEDTERVSNLLICVGQIEPRKNQLNLIRAANQLDVSLVIIGNPAPNHRAYFEECKKVATEKVTFVTRVKQKQLIPYYLSSAIHILPSWFETTGLSSLEAAYLGCKIIVSPNGDTKDYFGDYATYCEPQSVQSIKEAIIGALKREFSDELKQVIESNFTWRKAAERTKECYQSILAKL